jgi:4-hydroxy-tetrahydrodipicolinate reductase
MTVRIGIHGIGGRMGRAIAEALLEDADAEACSGIEREGSLLVGGEVLGVPVSDDLDAALAGCDVVIDFTTPEATARLAAACAAAKKPAVIGTTGLDAAAEAAIADLAAVAPVVVAPNMSMGVTLLFHLAARAAEALGPAFDAEIVEMHHRRKVDAPSGTAVRLAEVVARAKGLDPARHVVHGRSGQVGARPDAHSGVMTLRGGDVVGEHTLILAGTGERLELTHRATSRAIFARGAVRAARWVAGTAPGRYDMADVLGLR